MLLVIAALILLMPSITPAGISVSLGLTGFVVLPPLALLYTNTGTAVSLLYLVSNLILFFRVVENENRINRSLNWIIISLVIAACQAANVYSETLIWLLLSVTLFALDILERIYESQSASWHLLGELVPIILLMIVTVTSGGQSYQNTFSNLINSPLLGVLLVAASILRLPLYPLPGYNPRSWFRLSASISVGAALYLRIASLSASALPIPHVFVIILAGCAMLPAFIANITPTTDTKIWFISISLVATTVIAPLVDSSTGTGLAVLYLGLILILTPIIISGYGQITYQQKRVRKWLVAAALIQIMGIPLSLGLTTRWDLQYLMGADQNLAILFLTLTNLFITLSVWTSLSALVKQPVQDDRVIQSKLESWFTWAKLVVTMVVLVWLGLVGLFPALINLFLSGPLSFPESVKIYDAGIAVWIYPLVTTVIIPLGGAFFIQQQHMSQNNLKVSLVVIDKFLQLRWLYRGLAGVAGMMIQSIERVLRFLETRFMLGWEVVWMLLIIIIRADS
ncbi:MAG: hypothetical protein ACYC6L_12465 [Anaerolineae bacterium]